MKRFLQALLSLAILSLSLSATAGINSWTAIGPDGGYVTKVVFHPANPETLFALTYSGAYRSVNSGESWQRVQGAILPATSADLEIDPVNPARVYLTGMGAPLVSDDGGATFSPLTALPIGASDATQVEVSADGATVYLAGSGNLYQSTNHGSTWTPRGTLPGVNAVIRSLLVDPADASTLYGVGATSSQDTGLFLSEDGGATWQLAQTVLASDSIQALAASKTPRRLWIARRTTVYFSTDQGRHSTAVPFNDIALAVAVDPANADKIYATNITGEAFRSDDAGLHWTDVTNNLRIQQGYGIFPHPQRAGEVYVGGADLARTTNGGASWSLRHTGIRATRVYGFSANTARDRIYLNSSAAGVQFLQGGMDALGEVNTVALGDVLAQVVGSNPVYPSPFTIHAQEGAPGRLYAAFPNDVLRSTDGGNTWQPLHYPTGGNGLFIKTFASSPRVPDVIFAGSSSDVMRTVDGGDHWTNAGAGLPAGAIVPIVVAAASDVSFVYGVPVVPILGPVQSQQPQGVYRWNEPALRWDPASGGMGNVRVDDLVVHPTDPKLALAATTASVMKTTDGGSSWTAVAWDNTTYNGDLVKLAFDPVDPRIIYAANNAHIIRSITGGGSWETLLDLNSFTRQATALIADPGSPGTLLVGTAAESAFQFTVAPDLALQITAPPVRSTVGTALSYTLTAQNLGPFHATGVRVAVQLPAGSNGVSAVPANACIVATSTVNCSLDVLLSGQSSAITVNVTPGIAVAFAVSATISGAQEDPTSANNAANVSTTVETGGPLSPVDPPINHNSGGGGGALSLDVLLALTLLVLARLGAAEWSQGRSSADRSNSSNRSPSNLTPAQTSAESTPNSAMTPTMNANVNPASQLTSR
jgi:uncharacterized repeat protein (TIGR01451 family)